ncbi:hypothetical protein SE17_04770 [Kouleothrix aurantiaca]|uniref:Type II methyltransferase M.TaqI-like domain-containing protein n=1 Tax=Kouleothrix aurantiaca TaxID=186479 RepID=A0A0P9DL86_9CHLR|nr:hypothetical protein SE17_04770 [Kouleothrix aurantiaca]
MLHKVFDAMTLAGEAGSLLKIEDEITTIVAEAKRQWRAGPKLAQSTFLADRAERITQRALDLDASGITDATFWTRAEERIDAALKDYAAFAEGDGAYRRRLFADDAARGFAFIDLCRKRYDVVLMNPPFGETSERTQGYLQQNYPDWNFNLFCCFISRTLNFANYVGAITDRAYMLKTSYEDFRRNWHLQLQRLATLVDLGWGILDANVEVNLQIFEPQVQHIDIINLMNLADQRPNALLQACSMSSGNSWIAREHEYFLDLPNAVLSYELPVWQEAARKQGKNITENFATAVSGMKAGKVEQFVRLMWEVPEAERGSKKGWNYFQNGGSFAPYYYPTIWVLQYRSNWSHIKSVPSSRITGLEEYWRPGLSYGKRTDYIYCYPMPQGQIFSNEGMAVFPQQMRYVYQVMGFINSGSCQYLMNLLAGQHKAHSYFNKMALAMPITDENVSKNSEIIVNNLQRIDRTSETSMLFCVPLTSLLLEGQKETFAYTESEIINLVNDAERLLEQNSQLVAHILGDTDYVAAKIPNWAELIYEAPLSDNLFASSTLSYFVGCVLGRWDIRYATGERTIPELPDPFAPLPVCPPGMLQNAQGLPATHTSVPASYPLRITWPGILVDDEGHDEDIAGRVREAIQVIWGGRAEAIEQEACEILGVRALRDYISKPALFFADHLQRYSKSRRQAPIYWPLSTRSGDYTLWLYYHRLSDQTLYSCVNDFVEPKLAQVSDQAAGLRRKSGRTGKDEKDLERLTDLEQELQDFRAELLRVAAFWKPNLNDGVQITAAPLWKLFAHKPWQKRLKETWEKLEAGEYDWAHLSYSIWPDRVRTKCKTDKSLAIAHDLESLYVVSLAGAKKGRGKQVVEVEDE